MANSSFVFGGNNQGIQLLGLSGSGLPSKDQLESFVTFLKNNKKSNSVSYVRLIAQRIRAYSEAAVKGKSYAKRYSNYFGRYDLNPFKIAEAMGRQTSLPINAHTIDVENDDRLDAELKNLEDYLAGIYGGGPGYFDQGTYNFSRSSSSENETEETNGGSSEPEETSSNPLLSSFGSFGDIKPIYLIGGVAVIGGLLLMRG